VSIEIDVPSIDPRNDNGSVRRDCQIEGFKRVRMERRREIVDLVRRPGESVVWAGYDRLESE
jgi:hypothetical protein